jgi:hypothetical protein
MIITINGVQVEALEATIVLRRQDWASATANATAFAAAATATAPHMVVEETHVERTDRSTISTATVRIKDWSPRAQGFGGCQPTWPPEKEQGGEP